MIREGLMNKLCSYHRDCTKCISGAQTARHAAPELGDVHTVRLSPASIDVRLRDRHILTLPPVVRVK
jgi:hypothetical protein